MNTLKIKFYVFCIFALGLGGMFLYDKYDLAMNYEQVVATVTHVEETCYMTKTERGIGSKTKWTTKEGPCEIVQAINQNHPEYKDYRLVRNTVVAYQYQSPADGQYHTGKHKQAEHTDGRPVRYGDSLPIRAHRDDPEKTRKI